MLRLQFLHRLVTLVCVFYVARDLLWNPTCRSYTYPGCPACVNDVVELQDITHMDAEMFTSLFGKKFIFFIETSK